MSKTRFKLTTDLSFNDFVKKIISSSEFNISSYVCVSNVHMSIEAKKNPDFALIVNNADLVTPDGMPLVWAIRLLYGIKQERVAGMDLLPALLKEAEIKNLKICFYGGTESMLDLTKQYLKLNYSELLNPLFISPPFRELTQLEIEQDISKINEFGANLVFVALGCPKQEKWMAAMKGKINACMVGIGGALPVMIGMQKRAPIWMQKYGLEWLYRLIQEPRRLFKRYLVTNSLFVYYLIIELFKIRILKLKY